MVYFSFFRICSQPAKMSLNESKDSFSVSMDQSLDYSSPDEDLPETKKTLKRTLSSLEEMNRDHEAIIRKWKNLVKNAVLMKYFFCDIYDFSPVAKEEAGAWPLELILVRHGQSVCFFHFTFAEL